MSMRVSVRPSVRSLAACRAVEKSVLPAEAAARPVYE